MRPQQPARTGRGGFELLATALGTFLDRSGIGESLDRLGALDEWAEVVGDRVSRVTRAVEVRGDTLVVEVLSSAWINELATIRGLILTRLNERRSGPKIGEIRFRLAESPDDLGARDGNRAEKSSRRAEARSRRSDARSRQAEARSGRTNFRRTTFRRTKSGQDDQ